MSQGYLSWQYQDVYRAHGGPENSFIYRFIPDTQYADRISCYPFLPRDLLVWDVTPPYDFLDKKVITTTIITDPLITYAYAFKEENLYKQHAVVRLSAYCNHILPENHKRNIKKGQNLDVRIVLPCEQVVNKLHSNYQNLIQRHDISGTAWTHYTKDQLRQLINAPGAVLFEVEGGINYSLFYISGNNVYYHLSAQSPEGYANNTNFVMMDYAIRFFAGLGLDMLEIGAVPDGESGEGLRRFKYGFATYKYPNYIIKLIHSPEVYEELSKGKEAQFFPAYRG